MNLIKYENACGGGKNEKLSINGIINQLRESHVAGTRDSIEPEIEWNSCRSLRDIKRIWSAPLRLFAQSLPTQFPRN